MRITDGLQTRLSASELRQLERAAQTASEHHLQIVATGTYHGERTASGERTNAHAGRPMWLVTSHTSPGAYHFVIHSALGRLWCDCEASNYRFTCSHRACVRLALLAERAAAAVPASIPAAVAADLAAVAAPIAPVAPDVAPTSSPTPAAAVPAPLCPTCGTPTSRVELEQLGECLRCLTARATVKGPRCHQCGKLAAGETATGYLCNACARKAQSDFLTRRMAEQDAKGKADREKRDSADRARMRRHAERDAAIAALA